MSRKEYILSPIESILINKRMPRGFKLELVENLPQNNIKSNNNPLSLQSQKKAFDKTLTFQTNQSKCDYYIKEILSHPISTCFYIRKSSSEPSLIQLEKNVKLGKYKSINELDSDIKKFFLFYFDNFSSNKEIYNKALTLSEHANTILKAIEPQNHSNSNNSKHGSNKVPILNVKNDKPMTTEEKKALGDNIKKLDKEQLKGIVELLKGCINHDNSSKFFMFDIEQLPVRKCRELEAYVRSCLGEAYTDPIAKGKEQEKKDITLSNKKKDTRNDSALSESESDSESESW